MCSLGIPPHQEAHPLDGVHLQLVEVPEVLHGTLDKLRGDPLFRDVFGNGLDVLTLDPPHRPARVDDSERLVVEAHVGHDHPRRERLPHLVPLPEHQLHPEVRVDVLPAPLRATSPGNLPGGFTKPRDDRFLALAVVPHTEVDAEHRLQPLLERHGKRVAGERAVRHVAGNGVLATACWTAETDQDLFAHRVESLRNTNFLWRSIAARQPVPPPRPSASTSHASIPCLAIVYTT